jgi:tubby-related protein 1
MQLGTATQWDLEAQGLDGEYDPNEGKHPREVAAEKVREKEVAEAEAKGGAAKRTIGRPKPVKVGLCKLNAVVP